MTLPSLAWPDLIVRAGRYRLRALILQSINACANVGLARPSFAVAVIGNDTIVGRESQTVSVLCDLFSKERGTTSCVVTGLHQYSYGTTGIQEIT